MMVECIYDRPDTAMRELWRDGVCVAKFPAEHLTDFKYGRLVGSEAALPSPSCPEFRRMAGCSDAE
jgi:hypothetical protein